MAKKLSKIERKIGETEIPIILKISEWLPQLPDLGPPLPQHFNILWPRWFTHTGEVIRERRAKKVLYPHKR
jgi:hypothetical protein